MKFRKCLRVTVSRVVIQNNEEQENEGSFKLPIQETLVSFRQKRKKKKGKESSPYRGAIRECLRPSN